MGVKRQPHKTKQESTRSISYRLPEHIVEELETQAQQKEISQNVLVKQILEKYVEWDRFSTTIGIIPVPKEIIKVLGEKMDRDTINEIIQKMTPVIKDWVTFQKGGYDLKKIIELMEDYMRHSGMTSEHRIEGDIHHFVIQHNLGINWSLFTELLLKQVFHEFLPNLVMKTRTTANTIIASIALGSDFNEHEP
ncbi:MAG TPA: hypothetical protein VFP45_08225 [Candidatus Nitrosotalea sp.]|nr:hypothetical protein [Candidatus Nitrosotalea sp.]